MIEAAHATESESGSFYTATLTLFLTNEELAPTYIRILKGQPVLEETIALLGLTESPDELIKWITVESVFGTHLIQLNVKDVSESQSILIADTLAWVFIDQIQELVVKPYANNLTNLRTQLDELSATIGLTQLTIERLTLENIQSETELGQLEGLLTEHRNDYRTLQQDYETLRLTATGEAETVVLSESAQAPANPIQRGKLYTIVAVMIGLMAGIGLAFFLEYLDDTIKTPQDINQLLGLDTLGTIPRMIDGDDELVVVEQPRSPVAESFRMLGTNLRFYRLDKALNILLVTSPEPELGKSLIVANLAAAIAMSGSKVIVVDADLRRPRQHILFNLKSGEGLIGSLLDGESHDKLQDTRVENLSVLTSGKNLPPNPTELLGSRSMEKLINHLPADTDLILIDSPPVLNIADTAALTSWVDGVLLVLAAGNTKPAAAQQALANLQHVGATMVGAVLNAVSNQIGTYNYYQEFSTPGSDIHGRRQYRWGKSILSVREWVQSKNILPSFLGWFQIKEIMPSIRGWIQSKR